MLSITLGIPTVSNTVAFKCGELRTTYQSSNCCGNDDHRDTLVARAPSATLRDRIWEYEPYNSKSCSHYYTLPGYNYCKGGHISIARWGALMKGEVWPSGLETSDGFPLTGAIPSYVWPSVAPFPFLHVPSAVGDPIPNITAQDKMRTWFAQIQLLPNGDEKKIKSSLYHALKAYQIIFRIEEMAAKNDPAASLDAIMDVFFGSTSLKDPVDGYEYAPFYKSLHTITSSLRETNYLDSNGKFTIDSFAEYFFCGNHGYLRNKPQGTFTKISPYGGWDTFYEGRCTSPTGHATFHISQFTFHNCMSHMMGTMNAASLSDANPLKHKPIDFSEIEIKYGTQIKEFNNILSIGNYGTDIAPIPFQMKPSPFATDSVTSTFTLPADSLTIGTALAKFMETHKSVGRNRPVAAHTPQGNIMLNMMYDTMTHAHSMQCTESNVRKFTDATKTIGRFVNYARSDWSSIPFTTDTSYLLLKPCKVPTKTEPHYVNYGDTAMGGSGMIENYGTPNPYTTFIKLYLKYVCKLALDIETRCGYSQGPVPDTDRNFSAFSPVEKPATLARYVGVWAERIKDSPMSTHSAKPLFMPTHDVCYAGAELGEAKLALRDTMTDEELKNVILQMLGGSSGNTDNGGGNAGM